MNAIRAVLRWLADRLIPRRYVEVHGDDNWCVMEPHEADAWIEVEEEYQVEAEPDPEMRQTFTKRPVWMTRHRFNSLPDFDGY